jgi:hypothetical protein
LAIPFACIYDESGKKVSVLYTTNSKKRTPQSCEVRLRERPAPAAFWHGGPWELSSSITLVVSEKMDCFRKREGIHFLQTEVLGSVQVETMARDRSVSVPQKFVDRKAEGCLLRGQYVVLVIMLSKHQRLCILTFCRNLMRDGHCAGATMREKPDAKKSLHSV